MTVVRRYSTTLGFVILAVAIGYALYLQRHAIEENRIGFKVSQTTTLETIKCIIIERTQTEAAIDRCIRKGVAAGEAIRDGDKPKKQERDKPPRDQSVGRSVNPPPSQAAPPPPQPQPAPPPPGPPPRPHKTNDPRPRPSQSPDPIICVAGHCVDLPPLPPIPPANSVSQAGATAVISILVISGVTYLIEWRRREH